MIVDISMTIFGILYVLFTTTFAFLGLIAVTIYLFRMRLQDETPSQTHRKGSSAEGQNVEGQNVEEIKFVLKSDKAAVPRRATACSAGYDLSSVEKCVVPAKSHKAIKTDVGVVLPKNTYGRIASRSGLSFKNGVEVGAGTIDEDYRGELMVNLYNHSNVDFCVQPNQRIAQLIVQRIAYPHTLVEDVNGNIHPDNTSIRAIRGIGGFGSSDVVTDTLRP